MKLSLALPLLALLFVSCRQDKVTQGSLADPDQILRLEERLGSIEDHISQLNRALDDSRVQQNKLAELQSEISRLEAAAKRSETKNAAPKPLTLKPDSDGEIDPRVARLTAVGESLGTVYTLDGRKFYEARITRVTDVGIEIQHRDGSARLHFSGLAPDIRHRFPYVPEMAQKALQLERMLQAQRNQSTLQHTLAQLENEKKRRLVAEKQAHEFQARVVNTPVHNTTQIVVDPPIYRGSSHVVVNRPIIVDEPYCPPTTTIVRQPTVVTTPVVRRPQISRPSRPTTTVSKVTRPSQVTRQPSVPRPAVVRPRTPSRSISPMLSRPAPSRRR